MGFLLKIVLYGVVLYVLARLVARLLRHLAPPPRPPAAPGRGRGSVEELVACTRCGAYVAEAAGPCSRPECPRRG